MDTHYYTVNLDWNQQRKGMLCSPELNTESNNCLEVATPPEFPEGIAGIWSPEHLFTASVNSCLMTTFLAIAANSKLAFTNFKCGAKGKLEKVEGKFIMSEIELFPEVTISNEADREKALRIINKAEAACLISNSIKSKIMLRPEVIVAVA